MRREALRRDELAYRREPFVWPVDTPPTAMLARVEARAAALQRRRRMAFAMPVPVLLIALMLATVTPGVPGGQRLNTAPPAAEQHEQEDQAPAPTRAPNTPAPGTEAQSVFVPTGVGQAGDGLAPQPVTGSEPTAATDGRNPSWSSGSMADAMPAHARPATGRVAFVRDGRIWLINANGSDERPITPLGERWSQPAWRRDGRMLAVLHDGVTARGVILDLERGTRSFIPGIEKMSGPRWSPDGQWIAYSALSPANDHEAVWVVRPDGTENRMVAPRGGSPHWIGNDRLAYHNGSGSDIIGLDGRNQRLFSRHDFYMKLSLDGRRLLTMRQGLGVWELWETDLDLQNGRMILDRHNMQFDWTWDNEWTAVERTVPSSWCVQPSHGICDNLDRNIWLVSRDGKVMRQLTTGTSDMDLAVGPPAPA